ncbi:MAG TPA: CheR family methyltransferase [Pyrinomonadaceae bacterium]|nr:CheR family methyltransferase [Pyrinomonadaceae bacterium]
MATNNSENKSNDLVVVGSSAGGVGALSTLVSTLNKNFPAPIVLAQHLDPQRPSHLGSILERRSHLPIVMVDEQSPTPLDSGKIYVVPANRHVKIEDGHVLLEKDHHDRPKPSVDLLLSSAAASYGEHLIAVILTGAGSDGAAGAVEVKNAGGVVIIQNPQTAAYPSMPLSLPPTAVDHVVEMELIGPLLFDILRGVDLPVSEKAQGQTDDPLQNLLTHVSAQTNIDFRNYKSSTIMRRIGRRMAVTHNASLLGYTEYIHSHPDEIKELVRAFLIKVTGFFRDPEAFEFIRATIIPELVERGRGKGRILRLWSAGCATGEEAYTLALLLADHLGSEFTEWSIKIFATDLAADAINFARRGLYPANVLADLPDNYRDRYFERIDHGYRIGKSLRQVVIFGQQDISRGVPFPNIDLVACRNLLIYLKPELQQVVLDLFAYSLHQSHGYLFLGKAETTRPTKASFELVNKKWKIYRCLGGPGAIPLHDPMALTSHATAVTRETRRRQIVAAQTQGPLDMTQAEVEITQLRRLNETILRYTNVAVVIIDRLYRIVTINAQARRLLGIHDMAYDQDFLHTVRGLPYQEVRQAIDTAFREHATITVREMGLDEAVDGTGRFVSLTITIMQVELGAPELAVLTALDATEQVQGKRRLETVQREQSELVAELSASNKRFSAMNKELQDANEELQAANEELMLTQEELQATNEEFEATNEELQATNEELETNNEELQATNEELQTTNDELTARTLELQELMKQFRMDQLQLAHLLERFPHYVMVLRGDDLTIQTLSPSYQQLLGDRQPAGLPVSDVLSGDDLDQFNKLLRKAVRERQSVRTPPINATIPGADGSPFVHTIVPVLDENGTTIDRLFVYSDKAEG